MLGFKKKGKKGAKVEVKSGLPLKKSVSNTPADSRRGKNVKTVVKTTVQKPVIEKFKSGEVKKEIDKMVKMGIIHKKESQLLEQRAPVKHVVDKVKHKKDEKVKEYINTGVPGFDELIERGIPKGYSVIVAGGAGSGKTIFCLQAMAKKAAEGKKCIYMSFEESEERLKEHMRDFGWDAEKLLKSGNLVLKRFNPFDVTRSVDALLMKAKGELLIEMDPVIMPKGFKPDFIVVDSLTAIASAFSGRADNYRIYIEQLFRFFEKLCANSFLITETKQVPTIFSQTGVEEFLADGVIVFYNIKRGNIRERAIEVLKLRGAKHDEKIVALDISGKGITVYPQQQVFGEMVQA